MREEIAAAFRQLWESTTPAERDALARLGLRRIFLDHLEPGAHRDLGDE